MQINPKQKKLLIVLLIILISSLGLWLKFLFTPIIRDVKGMPYVVREGASLRAVIDDLHSLNVIKHPGFFKILVHIKGATHKLKAGKYLFPKGTTPPKLLTQLITGGGMIYHSFTIIPGKTFKDVRYSLAHNDSFKHTIDSQSDKEVMTSLGHPELNPEGEFFPDTYYFVEGAEDVVVLKKAFLTMQDKLNNAWQKRDVGLPFKTPYEALIAASIIEKEAYLEKELSQMAGVMVNRLRKDMLLQFDPTVIYGMGEQYTGKIRRSDLLSDNPYNTYRHKGLPPTPIAMPSKGAIDAVMHPAKHDYYYFVAQSDGSSKFTKQLAEHHRAVAAVAAVTKKESGYFNTELVRSYWLRRFAGEPILTLESKLQREHMTFNVDNTIKEMAANATHGPSLYSRLVASSKKLLAIMT
jgi:UPF0755 protein